MQLLVRAFPVLPGQEQAIFELAHDLSQNRSAEAVGFFDRHGVSRESWHLQETPLGPWVIAVTHFPEKPVEVAAQEYAESRHEFDSWFKGKVQQITGVNPDRTPLGPPTVCVFDTDSIK